MARPKKIVTTENVEEKNVAIPTGSVDNVTKRVRPTRRPNRADRLAAPKREGFYRRWVNEKAGRIERMQANGYEVVTMKTLGNTSGIEMDINRVGEPTQESTIVRREVGGGMFATLMEIPMEWYLAEKEEEQARIDSLERQRNTPSTGEGVNVHKNTKITNTAT